MLLLPKRKLRDVPEVVLNKVYIFLIFFKINFLAVERAKDVGNKKESKATTTVKTTTTKKAKKKVSTSEDSDDNDNNTTFDGEADDSTVMEDWTGGEGDPELCQLASCKRPKDMKINWVACDGCDKVWVNFLKEDFWGDFGEPRNF